MNLVQERFAEDFNEKELAKSFGLSYTHFSRSFKRVTGMTFKNYLNRTRIRKAEQLLFLSRCSISEVAVTCGYNSISYFIKVYRSITGKTPYKVLKS
jgi:AraC-like DNA-binding protein